RHTSSKRDWSSDVCSSDLATGNDRRRAGRPLSEELADLPEDGPHAGDRFPWLRLKFASSGPAEDLFEKLDDTRFNLLVLGQRARSEERRVGKEGTAGGGAW